MAFRKDDRLKDGPMPQYAGARAEVDDTLYGRDIEGPAIIRRTAGAPAAGQPTKALNKSFSGYEYLPSRLQGAGTRSFLMDDYPLDRSSRTNKPEQDQMYDFLQYQKEVAPWQPKQGFSETRFHNGFQRRQQPDIRQDEGRLAHVAAREKRADDFLPKRREHLTHLEGFAYNGYNIITGEDLDPAKDRARRPEARHVRDPYDERLKRMDADGAGGRLRDSTSRFFCTQEQLPRNQARSDFIENDGLLHTKRTSTVIGIGANPAQEIYSIGARENFTESQYAITRREASLAAAQRASDVAMVAALK